MTDLALSIRDVSKAYQLSEGGRRFTTLGEAFANLLQNGVQKRSNKRFWALRDISLDVRRGEVLGVIGRNGAGKTTLLKILSRVTEPTTGQIDVYGRVASLLEVGTGFHPELTGRENIYLNGAILGMGRREIEAKLDSIIAFSEIEAFLDTPVKRYSSGMQVRLAFAVAAHLEPEILLIDEVLAVGDTQFQKKCLGKMSEISGGHGRTILFVSHNLAAVRALCSRAILVDRGELICDGLVDQVVANYLEKFGGESGEVHWGADAAPRSQEFGFVFRRAWVENHHGAVSSSLAQDQPFSICVEYQVERHLPGLIIGFFMQNSQGVGICGSNDARVSRASDRVAGLYISRCCFPARVLNEDVYQVQFGADTPSGTEHLSLRTPFSLSFSVDDLEGHDGGRYKLPGVLRPALEWHIL
ncbi:MAG: ABC transporter ATP-binding protein [Verrucomicrobia bacterium]|nr:ABC transporter ATP-binding protein [Verrucomicrobiota bacterium]